MPIPAAVVPNPTTLERTNTVSDSVFSKLIDNTPEFIDDVNVPMKFVEVSTGEELSR